MSLLFNPQKSHRRASAEAMNTYKKIASVEKKSLTFITDCDTVAFVTTEDVPVLLSGMFGQPVSYNSKEKNPVIMYCGDAADDVSFSYGFMGINFSYGKSSSEGTYVREDKYDELSKIIENASLDHYYYTRYNPYPDSDYWYEDESYYENSYENRIAGDDVTKAINDTLEKGKEVPYEEIHDSSYSWSMLTLYPCDKEMLVTSSMIENYVTIISDGDDYYLIRLRENYPETFNFNQASEKDTKVFKKLFNDEKDSVEDDIEIENFFDY